MTVYNAGSYLAKAISSVLEQSHDDWELLIMDDGSTDREVGAVLSGLDRCDDRIRVLRLHTSDAIRQKSCRYATLVNWGAQLTEGEYITYLCGDDFYFPDRLERMVGTLNRGVDVVYGSQRLLDAYDTPIGSRRTLGILHDAFHLVDMNSVMHTREAFNAVGGWDDSPHLWRDADAHFWRRLSEAGYVFVPVDGPPTDAKHYRSDSVDMKVRRGLEPWE